MKDKAQGKAEEVMGRITGDPVQELKGKARQKVGTAKSKVSREIHGKDAQTDRR